MITNLHDLTSGMAPKNTEQYTHQTRHLGWSVISEIDDVIDGGIVLERSYRDRRQMAFFSYKKKKERKRERETCSQRRVIFFPFSRGMPMPKDFASANQDG